MKCHISEGPNPPSKHYENIKLADISENSGSHIGAAEDSGVQVGRVVVAEVRRIAVPPKGGELPNQRHTITH